MDKPQSGFYAIVSLLGHQQFAGFLDEFQMGGANFLRLTIPENGDIPAWTQMFTSSAVYSIVPCDQETAQSYAESLRKMPMDAWDFKKAMSKKLLAEGLVTVPRSELMFPEQDTNEIRHDDDDDISHPRHELASK